MGKPTRWREIRWKFNNGVGGRLEHGEENIDLKKRRKQYNNWGERGDKISNREEWDRIREKGNTLRSHWCKHSYISTRVQCPNITFTHQNKTQILAHSPMLVSTTGFNYIRWNIIVRLYPFSSLYCMRSLGLGFILVKGKDAAFKSPNPNSWLK